jgi:hypothetical protein
MQGWSQIACIADINGGKDGWLRSLAGAVLVRVGWAAPMAHHFEDGILRVLVVSNCRPSSCLDLDLGLRILEVARQHEVIASRRGRYRPEAGVPDDMQNFAKRS